MLDTLEPSADLIEWCGNAIHAAAESLSERRPDTRTIVTTIRALTDTADAARMLTEAAVGMFREDLNVLDLDVAVAYLIQAESVVATLRRAYDALDIPRG